MRENLNALRFAFVFFRVNQFLTLKAIIIFSIIFAIKIFIPFFNALASLIYGLLAMNLMVFIGKLSLENRDYISNNSSLREQSFYDVAFNYGNLTIGVILANFLINVSLYLLFVTIIQALPYTLKVEYIPKLIIMLNIFIILLTYISPLALSYSFNSKTLGEAFKSIFRVFTISLWRESFSFNYLQTWFIWIALNILMSILIFFILKFSINFFPIIVVILYFSMLYNGVVLTNLKYINKNRVD